jgi:flagellar motor switch protein FliM
LASKRIPIQQVLALVTGSIIQFEKQCDEPLTLAVGGREVAAGEAVKVGDKFGLRITSIIRSGERFSRVRSAEKSIDGGGQRDPGPQDSG